MSVIDVEPPIPKESIPPEGKKFLISGAEIKKDIQTQLGKVAKALIIVGTVAGDKEEYSQMFSIDKAEIAGSAGRILTALGVKHIDELDSKKLATFKGKSFIVKNRGGKLYWYTE